MKNSLTLFFIFLLVTLVSCRSSKELIYMKDVVNRSHIPGLNLQETQHTLKSGDILYVSIKTMNAEVNAVFNPESNMEMNTGQGFQKFTTPSGAYLYGFEIDRNGFIQLPMLGDIKVDGVTVDQVESIIRKKSDEFINDAIVKVKQLNFKVTISGEVRNPGVYFNYNNNMTVLEALALANGNTDFATINKVMVLRPDSTGYNPFLLDLSSKDAVKSEAFYLQPNDYVIVQPDKHKNFQLNSQAYSLTFSSISILLAVLGFVLK